MSSHRKVGSELAALGEGSWSLECQWLVRDFTEEEHDMPQLAVDAALSVFPFPGPNSEDTFDICLSVIDESGKPVTDLAQGDVTLIPLENAGGEIVSIHQAASGSGIYVMAVRAGPAGVAFTNGMSGYGVIVKKGVDRGQTVVEATFSGRP